uniref:Uncharacterized protein n=1 Tax=Solanum lycopersicum TaxID=4081 RepID=A0A3Q7FCU8_SOLLC
MRISSYFSVSILYRTKTMGSRCQHSLQFLKIKEGERLSIFISNCFILCNSRTKIMLLTARTCEILEKVQFHVNLFLAAMLRFKAF